MTNATDALHKLQTPSKSTTGLVLAGDCALVDCTFVDGVFVDGEFAG